MSKYDITDDMDDWEYALYNMRKQKKARLDALIKKYGFPVREQNLLKEDYAEYDLLKDDLAAMEAENLAQKPTPHGSSLDDDDMAKNAAIVKAKKEVGKSNHTLSLNDRVSIALDTLKYTPEALGEMLADGIIAKEHLQTMKKLIRN